VHTGGASYSELHPSATQWAVAVLFCLDMLTLAASALRSHGTRRTLLWTLQGDEDKDGSEAEMMSWQVVLALPGPVEWLNFYYLVPEAQVTARGF
jgi:hypothetical protein